MSRRLKFVGIGFLAALLLCTGMMVAERYVSAQEETPAAETTPAETTPAAETPAETPMAETPAEPAAEGAEAPAEAKPAEEETKGEAAFGLNDTEYALDNMMLFISAVLVLFMQAGFGLVEVGLNAAKNAVNIMFKNVMDLGVGVLLYFLIGYGLMYPGGNSIIGFGEKEGDDGKPTIKYNVLGFGQVGIADVSEDPAAAGALNPNVDFLFQVAFAATAATIVSGAVAGRMQFAGYLIYSVIITALIYPISGMWKWGGGFLAEMGFVDFAGSIVVHAVGGFAGLAGAMLLGPRIGRFVNGKSMPMPGHNIPFAALGVFILLIGWFGFNPGSQLAFTGKSNTDVVVLIAVNTLLAAAAGSVSAMILSWVLFKKPDLTMALNGVLGGLVGITANCDIVTYYGAIAIGLIAGLLVTMAILALDKFQIDDPVGAFPVHGVCGIWGGLATGLLGSVPDEMTRMSFIQVQAIGTVVICGWALAASLAMFAGIKALGLLRVSAEEELAGLDITEHGMYAYPPQLVVDTYGSAMAAAPAASGVLAHGKPSTEAV
jgi:ammonium transporter, Amt family